MFLLLFCLKKIEERNDFNLLVLKYRKSLCGCGVMRRFFRAMSMNVFCVIEVNVSEHSVRIKTSKLHAIVTETYCSTSDDQCHVTFAGHIDFLALPQRIVYGECVNCDAKMFRVYLRETLSTRIVSENWYKEFIHSETLGTIEWFYKSENSSI